MSLVLTYAEIRREIGRFLGIGTNVDNWSQDDTTNVADIIRRGSRRFYFPESVMVADGQPPLSHLWSWLQSELTVALSSGLTYHDLPTNFLRFVERPSIGGSDYPLEEVQESDIRDLVNSGDGDGFPQYYAVKRTPSSENLGYRVAVYPKPTRAITMSGWYVFDPDDISETVPPIVPSNHSETFLAALLATADLMLNIESSQGVHEVRFKTLLAASIQHDMMIGGT